MIRTYSELIKLPTFEERYNYLALKGQVGNKTFGYDRWMNQRFYTSNEWRRLRHQVLLRDNACDLAVEGRDIFQRPIIHHMNPMDIEQIVHGSDDILDVEYLITVTHRTHNAIHYGDESLLYKEFKERSRGDTRLW